eukprot:GHUV01001818.1.p1 GENE.GHUV01001818.1~~GHUV01001818.1.p1  ORF type:complete len:492 (+),score=141.61 GHUV01001818.1:197-1672(+)
MANADSVPRAPMASLTMSSTLSRPSTSTAATVVKTVPSLRGPRGVSARAKLQRVLADTAVRASIQPASNSAQPRQLKRAGLNALAIHLVTGAVLLHFARKASVRVLPALFPKHIGGGNSGRPGMPGGRKPAIVWFRNDLRLHDHEPLAAASSSATSLLPVYIFDPREYGKSPNGFDKTGPYRARFILEALHDLKARLQEAGSDLVVRIGKPEVVLPELSRAIGAGAVYCHGEVTAEECAVESDVKKALDKAGAALKVMWGNTLFHVEDLPFQLPNMPSNYSDFRNALRGKAVRSPVETPAQIKALPAASVTPGDIPSLQQLGFDAATLSRCASDSSAMGAQLRGGESEALNRLRNFIRNFIPQAHSSGSDRIATASHSSRSRPSAPAPDFCCKISPWLALGCLSPRQLYVQLQQEAGTAAAGVSAQQQHQVKPAGEEVDTGMQWLLFELLWRDFFRFITKKYTVTGVAQRLSKKARLQQAPGTPVLALAGC